MFESREYEKHHSLPVLTAWISTCLLSAALGPLIPDGIRTVWGCFGLFGLAAGIGLSVLNRARLTEYERAQAQAAAEYTRQQLAQLGMFMRRITGNRSQ